MPIHEINFLVEYEAQLEQAIRNQDPIAGRNKGRDERAAWNYRCGCVDGLRMALQMLHDLIDAQQKGGDANGT